MHIDRIYSQQKATQMLREEHSTRPLGENLPSTNVSRLHKISSSKCPGKGSGGRVE